MDLSLQQITYLITVAEQQSFGKAAKLCYVTQPTLSMQVKKAEEVLGFSFFNRDRNPIELTAADRDWNKQRYTQAVRRLEGFARKVARTPGINKPARPRGI